MDVNSLAMKSKALPLASGCYLLKDSLGKVLYVGKAKNLRARVSSYFNQSEKNIKTKYLVEKVADFEFILTDNNAEAFILENNLIKKFSPKYNIQLRDDKSYPYIVLDTKEPFPTPKYMRRPKRKEGRQIFGPFPVGSNIFEVLRIIIKCFKLRDCSLKEFLSRKYPCILYQMDQCSAPCVGKITVEDYQKDLQNALAILKGKGKESLKFLKQRMHQLAEATEFEQATILRDAILQLEKFLEDAQQKNVEFLSSRENVDIMAYYKGEEEVDMVLYLIRQGVLLGIKTFHFPASESWEDLEEDILTYLFEYYRSTIDPLPKAIVLPLEGPHRKSLEEALGNLPGNDPPLRVQGPGRKYQKVMELTKLRAMEGQRVRTLQKDSVFLALNKLKDLLSLEERPRILECYDVAIWQGKSPTASQIVFKDGLPQKEACRHYHLQERAEGNNDFAMIREVVERRLSHGNLPDIFIVDGGKAQAGAMRSVLQKFQLSIPVLGIAKAKGNNPEERLFIEGRQGPLPLSRDVALFRLITQMRNEAHRFSRKLHHKAEKKRLINSKRK